LTADAAVLCIIPGPSRTIAFDFDDRWSRWCFTCRAHRNHIWTLTDDPLPRNVEFADWEGLDGYAEASIVMPSYYDPTWTIHCPQGHSAIHFPGRDPW
jgi:hypothetical protein